MRSIEEKLAWAGGLFCGEGSTSVLKAKRDKYAYLRMSVSQKDRKVLDIFQSIVGAGKVYANKREMHSWDCYRQDEVYKVLDMLWPYLSEEKQAQANKARERVAST